jgi:hypothetical protein
MPYSPFGVSPSHSRDEDGYVLLYRLLPDDDGDLVDVEVAKIRYIISSGYRSTWEEPGEPDDVELEIPAGLVITAAEEKDLIQKALDRHVWHS